jgi:hypothetical protein
MIENRGNNIQLPLRKEELDPDRLAKDPRFHEEFTATLVFDRL